MMRNTKGWMSLVSGSREVKRERVKAQVEGRRLGDEIRSSKIVAFEVR